MQKSILYPLHTVTLGKAIFLYFKCSIVKVVLIGWGYAAARLLIEFVPAKFTVYTVYLCLFCRKRKELCCCQTAYRVCASQNYSVYCISLSVLQKKKRTVLLPDCLSKFVPAKFSVSSIYVLQKMIKIVLSVCLSGYLHSIYEFTVYCIYVSLYWR
jgi:hypothetical protein